MSTNQGPLALESRVIIVGTCKMTIVKNQNKLEIAYKSLSSLIVYAKNARTHSAEQVDEVAASIKQFGWTNPILIDERGEVIAGHGRSEERREQLMSAISVELSTLQDISATGAATAAELFRLNALINYRIALLRLDVISGVWPAIAYQKGTE